jgi:hypothetical protein
MNKKAHHEAGIFPYVVLGSLFGFVIVFFKKVIYGLIKG